MPLISAKELRLQSVLSSDDKELKLRFTREERLQLGVILSTNLLWQLVMGVALPVLPTFAQSIDCPIGLAVSAPSVARSVNQNKSEYLKVL
jgi:hypothetical protein